MAKIEKIKAGDILYSVEGRECRAYLIKVISVDIATLSFLGQQIKKLQYKEPK